MRSKYYEMTIRKFLFSYKTSFNWILLCTISEFICNRLPFIQREEQAQLIRVLILRKVSCLPFRFQIRSRERDGYAGFPTSNECAHLKRESQEASLISNWRS